MGREDHSPQQTQEEADRKEEADPHGPEVAQDAGADVVVEDADGRDGGREQQLDRQDAVHFADEALKRNRKNQGRGLL